MAKRGLAGLTGAMLLLPTVVMAQNDSRGAPPMMPPPAMNQPMRMPPPPPPPHAMMQRDMSTRPGGDRWADVPGGWSAYRAPSYGYRLPQHWMAPGHFIADYRTHGLRQPGHGFGWSRYYDDMVLTDRWGRVYDWQDTRASYDNYDDRADYRGERRRGDKSGIVGALIGGAIGALTGNVIAGAGSRLAGSLIGGGVGALAGQAIDQSSSHRGRGRDRYRDDDYGRMHGPHLQDDGPAYSYANGDCGCETVTTTTTVRQLKPVVTTSVRYVTEYVTVPARARYAPRTKYVPRGKYVPVG